MLSASQITFLYQSLGSRIKGFREEKKLKQEYFASLLGISRASLINIEQGRQRPPLHNLYEISRILDIPISELLPPIPVEAVKDLKAQYAQAVDKKNLSNPEKLIDFVKSV